jgi:hypothetical protein
MMAMTISNSINVNAPRAELVFFILTAFALGVWTLRVPRRVHSIYLLASGVLSNRQRNAQYARLTR